MTDPTAEQPIVKICGITSVADGLAALEAGADWLGLVRWPKSKRFVTTEAAAGLAAQLRDRAPRPFQAVGVYVDADRATIERDVEAIGLDRIQLHGEETPEFARALQRPALKAIRARDRRTAHELAERYAGLDLLADAFDEGLPGGTGVEYDYGILADLTRSRRVIVAGGLHPGNVGDIVGRLRPWGVDVSSGVESAPGRKDPGLVRAFIEAARRAQTAD